jgi:hypothetical protein
MGSSPSPYTHGQAGPYRGSTVSKRFGDDKLGTCAASGRAAALLGGPGRGPFPRSPLVGCFLGSVGADRWENAMGSPDPNARGRTFRTARAAAFSALFLLPLPACHGRPLVSQMAHARDSASGRTRAPSGRQRQASQSPELLDGRSRLSNPANRMKPEDFRRIAQEMARRDAGSSRPRRSRTPERAVLADGPFEEPVRAELERWRRSDPSDLAHPTSGVESGER